MQGGGGSPEPATEWHPRLNPSENLTIAIKQSVLADAVKSNVKDGAPAPVRVSETGRARNWTMPPLRLERDCIYYRFVRGEILQRLIIVA